MNLEKKQNPEFEVEVAEREAIPERLLHALLEAGQVEPPASAQDKMQLHLVGLDNQSQPPPQRSIRLLSLLAWIRTRPLQFSLRGLLFMMLLCCIPIFVFVRPYLLQQVAAREVIRLGGTAGTAPGGPQWLHEHFGGALSDVVEIDVADCDDAAKYMHHILRCPKLEVLVVGGEGFTDEHLKSLAQLKRLKGLVLDSTGHTPQGLRLLQASLPRLEVRRSWRRIEDAMSKVATFKTGTPPTLPNTRITVSFEWPYQQFGGPDWLRSRTKDIYFKDLITVDLNEKATDDDLKRVSKLGEFQALRIKGSRLTDQGLEKLKIHSRSQISLDYSKHNCLISVHGLKMLLRNHDELFNLMIYGVPLAKGDLSFLRKHRNLEYLTLAECGIDDGQLSAIVPLSLEGLNVQGNPITDAGLKKLQRMRSLQSLRLHGTKVTYRGVDDFKYDMPYCRVAWSPPKSE